MFSGHRLSRISIVIILCLYLIFPSGLSTTDGWFYAASIKHCVEIFHPHHLLYNPLGIIFSWLPSRAGIEVLSSMKVLNSFFAFFVLIVIQQILYKFNISEKQVVLISCLTGFSFSMIRYATENEAYIVPMFFALLASLNWVRFLKEKNDRFALYAGLCASLAVLFHQTYIFWWAGLLAAFLNEKEKRASLLYFLVSLSGPVVYLLVILTTVGTGWNDILNFILGSFRSNATLGITIKGLYLSFINLIRSFIQIHGYIYNMARYNLLLALPGIVSAVFVFFAFLKFPRKISKGVSQKFITIHILIIVLQFIFAILSFGNAEFMVMIPVLTFMMIPFYTVNNEKFLIRIAIALAVWNISYGLLPLHYKSQEPEQSLCKTAIEEKSLVIIASDDQLLKSMLYYKTGDNNIKGILKSPASLNRRGESQAVLMGVIDSALNKGIKVVANCLDDEPISRQSILEGDLNRNFFSKYKTSLMSSWKQSTGTRSVYNIERKP